MRYGREGECRVGQGRVSSSSSSNSVCRYIIYIYIYIYICICVYIYIYIHAYIYIYKSLRPRSISSQHPSMPASQGKNTILHEGRFRGHTMKGPAINISNQLNKLMYVPTCQHPGSCWQATPCARA